MYNCVYFQLQSSASKPSQETTTSGETSATQQT